MLDARLPLALNGGGLDLPEGGAIAVFGPSPDLTLSDLPRDRVQIIEGFKPSFDRWHAAGFQVSVEPEGWFSAAVVCLPRAKAEARSLIADACALCDGPVVIDGQKTDGADSVLKELRKRVIVHGPINKAHGKLFWIDATDQFVDWAQKPALTDGGFWTAPGVFSADEIDMASALLVDALPDKLGAQVADLGAGWGFLSAHVLTRPDVEAVHLVEASHIALECARRNVTDPRAQYHWADATTWRPQIKVDSVVMNPPFHIGRAADPQLGQSFVQAAAMTLRPSGDLWMVSNRHLPYETELAAHFNHVKEIGGDTRFKLFHAQGVRRARR